MGHYLNTMKSSSSCSWEDVFKRRTRFVLKIHRIDFTNSWLLGIKKHSFKWLKTFQNPWFHYFFMQQKHFLIKVPTMYTPIKRACKICVLQATSFLWKNSKFRHLAWKILEKFPCNMQIFLHIFHAKCWQPLSKNYFPDLFGLYLTSAN